MRVKDLHKFNPEAEVGVIINGILHTNLSLSWSSSDGGDDCSGQERDIDKEKMEAAEVNLNLENDAEWDDSLYPDSRK